MGSDHTDFVPSPCDEFSDSFEELEGLLRHAGYSVDNPVDSVDSVSDDHAWRAGIHRAAAGEEPWNGWGNNNWNGWNANGWNAWNAKPWPEAQPAVPKPPEFKDEAQSEVSDADGSDGDESSRLGVNQKTKFETPLMFKKRKDNDCSDMLCKRNLVCFGMQYRR